MPILKNRNIFQICILGVAFAMLFFAVSLAVSAQTQEEEEDEVDEEKVEEVKDDVADIKGDIKEAEKERDKLAKELNEIQSSLNAVQYELQRTQSAISRTENEIERKATEIEALSQRLEFQKKILASLLQSLYFNSQTPVAETLLHAGGFTKVFAAGDNLLTFQERINILIDDIHETKESLSDEKDSLEEAKKEKEQLYAVQQRQKQELASERARAQTNVAKQDATISDLRSQLASLRTELSSLLGEDFDTDDIVEAIEFASDKTGVREEFLMAMLDKESDLGRFTGGCNYKESKMGDRNLAIFKDIADELGYNYKKLKVSCPLSYGIGGAMGVAQFMPSTWIGYKDAIASMTGHNPPDPWSLADGVVGMAEKLRRGGADDEDGEHYAAKLYYCGGPSSAHWNTHCEAYADTVISWANSDVYEDFFN